MNSKLYKHKKTGKLYSLVQENVKVKRDAVFLEDTNEKFANVLTQFNDGRSEYAIEDVAQKHNL